MSRLALRVVRVDEPPSYRLAPSRPRHRLTIWRQRWDRRSELNREMRSQAARLRVTTSEDYPGSFLMPGDARQGRLVDLPRPLRKKARRALVAYYVTTPSIAAEYPWTPLPGDPRSRVTDVRHG